MCVCGCIAMHRARAAAARTNSQTLALLHRQTKHAWQAYKREGLRVQLHQTQDLIHKVLHGRCKTKLTIHNALSVNL